MTGENRPHLVIVNLSDTEHLRDKVGVSACQDCECGVYKPNEQY